MQILLKFISSKKYVVICTSTLLFLVAPRCLQLPGVLSSAVMNTCRWFLRVLLAVGCCIVGHVSIELVQITRPSCGLGCTTVKIFLSSGGCKVVSYCFACLLFSD